MTGTSSSNSPTASGAVVITRFAPSPTGYLHIGGARTALFNWVYARQHGERARFILRIEDTDKARSTPAATRRILDDLQWLGLDWDEGPRRDLKPTDDPYTNQIGDRGPYFQSERDTLYHDAIQHLLDAGRAYKCFKTAEQLTAERDAARQAKQPYKYDRTESVNLTPQQIDQYQQEGRPYVIRFRMPDEAVVVDDLVLGQVRIEPSELEDFIIVKSDGGPTFHLANVVDDHHMGITHVLRGQEHLMNTPKHVALFDALGWARPNYAHMPLIFNPDGSKMSKRDKAKVAREAAKANNLPSVGFDETRFEDFMAKKSDDTDLAAQIAEKLDLKLPEIDVHDFRRSGYLPNVLLNYLALLGWSPGNDIERFDLDFMVERFSIQRIGKSHARFDRDKLFRFNAEAIAALSPETFRDKLRDHFQQFHPQYLEKMDDARFARFAESYRERSRTLDEPAIGGRFFIEADDAVEFDQKAVKKVLLKGDGLAILAELRDALAAIDPWTGDAAHDTVKHLAEQRDINMGKVAQPLRVAVSGNTVSPPIDATLDILGKTSTLARIDRCLKLSAVEQPG